MATNTDSSKTQKAAKNFIIGNITYLFQTILSFFSRSIFIYILSVEYLGLSGLFGNIFVLLSFAELGIGEISIYKMYKPVKENDTNTIKKLLLIYKKFYKNIAIVISLVGIVIAFFLPYLILEMPNIEENIYIIYFLYLLNTVVSYLGVYKKSILYAYQQNYKISIINQITAFLQIISQIIVLLLFKNIYIYILMLSLFTMINNFATIFIVNKNYPEYKDLNNIEEDKEIKKSIMVKIKDLAVSKVAGIIANGTDNIVISKFVGLTSVGILSNYTLIINAVNGMFYAAISSISTSIGSFNISSTVGEKKKLFDELTLITYWLYSIICICLITLLNPFIELWLGNEYIFNIVIIIPLVITIYIGGVNFPAYSFRTTLGMFKEMKYAYLLFGILNIILSLILVRYIDIFGVLLATVITRILICESVEGYLAYKKILNIPVIKYYMKHILLAIIFIINGIITFYIAAIFNGNTIIDFIIKCIVTFITSNLILLIIFVRTKEFKRICERLKILVKERKKVNV